MPILFSFNCLAYKSEWLVPYKNIEGIHGLDFWSGYSFFKSPWVIAPATTKARDGLGPLFNARSCDACHQNGAGGTTKDGGLAFVMRIGDDANHAVLERYGQQLQLFAIKNIARGATVKPEVRLQLAWHQQEVTLSAKTFTVKTPVYTLTDKAYGDIPDVTPLSFRIAPPLYGLGLIDAVAEKTLFSRHDPNDEDADGISGRVNKVWDIKKPMHVAGRFGLKNEQTNLLQQIAGAFSEDIGISSSFFPQQNCVKQQKK